MKWEKTPAPLGPSTGEGAINADDLAPPAWHRIRELAWRLPRLLAGLGPLGPRGPEDGPPVLVIPGFLSYRIWRRFARLHEDSGEVPARSRFMAAVGVLISLLMAAVVVAQWLPVFIHHPCER